MKGHLQRELLPMAPTSAAPKAFISYSWTSDEHVTWVMSLGERLRSDNVDVILDQWDLKEGQDKHAFMEQMVSDPEVIKVLAVCDQVYAAKADGRRGGVGTETQIISPEVYTKVRQEKFIPLVREWNEEVDPREPYLPVYFKNAIYIDFSTADRFEEAYDRLLRNIHGRPERKKPPLGPAPPHLFAETATHVKTAGKLERLKHAVQNGKPHTQALLKDYLETFVEAMEDFRITPMRNGEKPFDETVIESITVFTAYRDNLVDLVQFVARYMDDDETHENIVGFLENILPFREQTDRNPGYRDAQDNFTFILYELFLYFIAVLLREKRYASAARFIEGSYHYTYDNGGSRHVDGGAASFNNPASSLDEHRNQRLNLRRLSVIGDLVRERATHPKIRFSDLFQADILLFVRRYFPSPGHAGYWWPRCIVHARDVGMLELFGRATSTTGIKPLQQLLKVTTVADLWVKINQMFQINDFKEYVGHVRRFRDSDWEELLNLRVIHSVAEQGQR